MQEVKRGVGRPPKGKGTRHIDLTLSIEVVAFLRSLPLGVRSDFVDVCIKQHSDCIQYQKEKSMQNLQEALKESGMAEVYYDSYTAIVREDENTETFQPEYVLTI